MAYVVSSLTGSSGASATIVTALPAHITGDLLVVFLVNDVGGTDIVQSGGADWTMVDSTRTNGLGCRFAYKIAASAAEASPTFSGRNDDWFYTSIAIRDADPTTPILTIAQSNFTAASTIDSPALTTSEADVLILYGIAGDTALTYNFPAGDLVYIAQGVISTAISSHIGWRNVIPTTTAFPTVTVTPSASATGVRWLIPIKNKSGGGMHGEARTVATKVRDYGTVFDAGTYSSPNTALGAITIESIAVSTATAIADGTTQYAQINSAEVAAVWAGGFDTFGAIKDLSGKILSVNWVLASGSVATTYTSTNGAIFVIMDDSNNWKAFRLALNLYGQLELVNNRINYIDVDSGTTVATSGACNTSRIIKFGFMYAKPSSSNQNYFRLFSVYAQDKVILTGGNSATPLTPAMADKVVDTWKISGMTSLQGSGQTISGQGIQIGDGGTNVTYANFAGQSLEMPLPFASNYLWNVADNKFTVTIYAGSSDTINLSSCILRANSPQNFAIHASSTAADVYNFNGLSLIGWTVTDNKGLTWNGTTFSSGGTVTIAGGGDLTNCTISSTASANAALAITANGSTLDGCTIDGTGAAYALELGTSVTAITLTDCTLTAGSTDKVHVLKASGTVTITISGTTSLVAGDVTTAGATVVIAAPSPTLDATVLASSRVVLYNNTTAAELDNTAPAGTSWSKVITSGASSGDTLTLHVFKEGYEEFSTSFIYAGTDNTLLVTQTVHAAIASLRTELGITDYTTITEFALDITGTVEIDADDADGNTMKARLAIWYNGVLTTENGARYLRGAISILSTAAIRINVSVLDLQVANVSVTYGLNFTDTDRRLYRSDGTAIYSAASAPGSIQNDYSGVPDTVTTSDQSLNLATAEQAIDNKLSSISSGVWAYVVTGSTTAVQMMRGFAAMLLGKVSGAGTGAETFRDIADTKDVATFTVDSSGNRTAVTRDLT